MTDCGDQSNYKAFFYDNDKFGLNLFETIRDKCYFYKYNGPESNTGFPNYKAMNKTNCDDFSQFCRVYANTTAGKYFLLI